MWEHFLECLRSRNPETLCPAELGYAAITTVNLGVQSYREGKAYYFDKETGEVTDADARWAARWEERSQLRGKPNQVIGWKAGDTGSLLKPPDYQKLEGDWVDGKDPGRHRLESDVRRRSRGHLRAGGSSRDGLPLVACPDRPVSSAPNGRSHRHARDEARWLGRRKMTRSAGSPGARRGTGRPSSRAGLVVTVAMRLLERPAGRGQQVAQAGFEPLVRAGQIGCARHDDLARRIDGPLAVNAGRQPGERAGVADQDRAAPALSPAPARAASPGRDGGRRR